MTDFFDDLERELRRAHRRDVERHASSRVFDFRRRLPGIRVAGRRTLVALAAVLALVAVVVAVAWESDLERPAAPPGKKVVATDTAAGIQFSLDGRVLTVRLLSKRLANYERVSGARISATCGGAYTGLPVEPRRATTVTRPWPAGRTSLSYRFPRDVSKWCRLEDQSGSIVAIAWFPSPKLSRPFETPEMKRRAVQTANQWAREFAAPGALRGACTLGQPTCRFVCQRWNRPGPIRNCTPPSSAFRRSFRGATVQEIAINGDRAAARFSNGETVELVGVFVEARWVIDKIGENAGRGF